MKTDTTILDGIRRMAEWWSATPIAVSDQRALDANRAFWQRLTNEQWLLLKAYMTTVDRQYRPSRRTFIEETAPEFLIQAGQWKAVERAKAERARRAHQNRTREARSSGVPNREPDSEAVYKRSEAPQLLADAIEANIEKLEALCGRKMRRAGGSGENT